MNKNYRVTIAHAVGSEDGGKTGKLGDQTGKEVRIQEWYASGGKWDAVIRCKNEANRLKIARNAEAGARNPLLGYSQPNRYTAYDQIKYKGFDYTKLDKPGDTDCSQMTTTNSSYAGYAIPRDTYTGNMLERYKATKAFEIYKSDKYTLGYKKLVPGDILLREGHHAATVINNIYWLKSILKKSNSSGRTEDVKALQARLNEVNNAKLKVDGIFGANTELAVKNYQYDNDLDVDGIVGQKTATALGFVFA